MYIYRKYNSSRHATWAIYKGDKLICITVYKKGAIAVCNELNNILFNNVVNATFNN